MKKGRVLWRSKLSETVLATPRHQHVTGMFWNDSKPGLGRVSIAVQEDDRGALVAVGLGLSGKSNPAATGGSTTRFDHWMPFEPLGLHELNDEIFELTGSERYFVTDPQLLVASKYDSGDTPTVILRALVNLRPLIGDWLERITGVPFAPMEFRQVLSETRDALRLASELSGVDLPSDVFLSPAPVDATDALLEAVVNNAYTADLEEDLIPVELRRFDDAVLGQTAGCMSIFRDGGYELAVFNVNKKPFEIELGVDLVYWDTTNDAFTLVQYKRLEKQGTSRDDQMPWVYTREGELRKQLELMPTLKATPKSSRDWRMTASPFWFKFVRGDALREDDGRLLRGLYVPAEYLRLALADGSLRTGPNGGFRLGHANVKYVDKNSFVVLLRHGLVGTDSVHSKDLEKAVVDLSKTGRQTLIAVKWKWQREAIHEPDDVF